MGVLVQLEPAVMHAFEMSEICSSLQRTLLVLETMCKFPTFVPIIGCALVRLFAVR